MELTFIYTFCRQDDVKGRPFSILEGPNTDATALTTLKTEIQRGRAASSLVLNYKRDGSSFLNYLRVYPLIGDSLGTVTHFLGVSQVLISVFNFPLLDIPGTQSIFRCLPYSMDSGRHFTRLIETLLTKIFQRYKALFMPFLTS